MAKPINIPKTTSSLADPDAPSFLTTLPPEVRNAIYEVLFKRDEPVLVHNAGSYYPDHPDRVDYDDDDTYSQALKTYDEAFEDNVRNGEEFKHEFGCGLVVLLSCRQVYHECAGVLYGSNTFIISRALHRHDYDSHTGTSAYDESYLQSFYAPIWLSSIGSHVDLLQMVQIDVDAACPSDSDHAIDYFDILPLLRLIWLRPELQHKISYSRTGRHVKGHDETRMQSANSEPERRTEILNNLLGALSVHDVLNLKRYRRWDRLLQCVRVIHTDNKEDNGRVEIWFHRISPSRLYRVSDVGRTLAQFESTEEKGLVHLPHDILYRICEFVTHAPSGIVFDLDKRVIENLDISLLQLNGWLRLYADISFAIAQANKLTLRASSTETTTSFDNFSALQDLHGTPRQRGVLADILYVPRSSKSPLTVELAFNVSNNVTFSDLSIDVGGIGYLLCQDSSVDLRISLTCPRRQHVHKDEFTVDIVRLRVSIFLVLCDMIEQWLANSLPPKIGCKLTSLCMDGTGDLKSTACSNLEGTLQYTQPNDYCDLSKEEMLQYGYRKAAGLKCIDPEMQVDETG